MLRVLGNSDMRLTPIGIGSMAFGGGEWQYALGSQDENESIATIHCALDHGINWIDTAPVYGLGRSGEIVARAVKSSGKKPFIFTKCSIRWRSEGSLFNSLKAKSVSEEVEASLRRLGVETIDLCQVHHPEPDNEIEEGWQTLARLREQGKIRWIGVSNFSVEQMKRVQEIAPITSLQPPYSLLDRRVEAKILPFAQTNGIGVINCSPLCTGLLSGHVTAATVAAMPANDHRRQRNAFCEPRLSRNLRLVKLLREIGNAHGVSPGVVAVAWTLHHPAITGAIVGFRSVKQVVEMASALHFRLSEEEFQRIGSYMRSIRWYLQKVYGRLAPTARP